MIRKRQAFAGGRAGLIALAVAWSCTARALPAAEFDLPPQLQAKVNAAIAKGITWLKSSPGIEASGEAALSGYALLKAGVRHDDPVIVRQRDALLAKIAGGAYAPRATPKHFNYEGACDAMFLEALDGAKYQNELTVLRDFLIRNQLETGSWYYPGGQQTEADTSMTQYAVLGLWAIERAGIEVPRSVWARTARYLTDTQRRDGGFAYHPFQVSIPQHTVTTPSMTAAGLGTSLLIMQLLHGGSSEPLAEPSRRRFGVLEQLVDSTPDQAAPVRKENTPVVTRETLRKVIKDAEDALIRIFENGLERAGTPPPPFQLYFLYSCERVGAFRQSDRLGDVAWYERGVDYLLLRQDREGKWTTTTAYSPTVDTSFALLFLVRATSTLVPKRAPRPVGGGLLVGGRGLPTDLSTVAVRNGEVERRLPKGAVDQLLMELEQPDDVRLPTQATAAPQPEQVSVSSPQELIGQMERLRRLLNHPEAEARQMAVWALSRSGDYRVAPELIRMLRDPDPVVAWEASLGLCLISHMPEGATLPGGKALVPIQPPGESPDPNSPELERWRDQSVRAWDAWYQQSRPYQERDDRRSIRNK